MIPEAKLERVLDRFHAIEAQLSSGADGEISSSCPRNTAELAPVVGAILRLQGHRQRDRGQRGAARPIRAPTPNCKALAEEEVRRPARALADARTRRASCCCCRRTPPIHRARSSKSAPAPAATKPRSSPATCSKMYTRYAQLQGWKTELLSLSESDLGGVKEAMLEVEGEGAYAKLKFESGVHRVQRVPVTEGPGPHPHVGGDRGGAARSPKMSTSMMQDKDLRIDVYRASGRGRPARQQDRERRAHHASSDRHRGGDAGRKVAAQEPAPRR